MKPNYRKRSLTPRNIMIKMTAAAGFCVISLFTLSMLLLENSLSASFLAGMLTLTIPILIWFILKPVFNHFLQI